MRHAADLMLGMLSGLDRKNHWTIAERRGDPSPAGLQHLLSRARWDAEAVRDDLREYVTDAFADPDAVRPNTSPGLTSTKPDAGPSGTAGPPWPCSPTRSWPWQPRPNATTPQCQPG